MMADLAVILQDAHDLIAKRYGGVERYLRRYAQDTYQHQQSFHLFIAPWLD